MLLCRKYYWSTDDIFLICSIAGYFGDLGDGVHKGDEDDPRVTVIEVVPDEIHYFLATEGTIRRAVSEAVGAITGDVATPGELRTISKSEVGRFNSWISL